VDYGFYGEWMPELMQYVEEDLTVKWKKELELSQVVTYSKIMFLNGELKILFQSIWALWFTNP
jgi:hypothetical protein